MLAQEYFNIYYNPLWWLPWVIFVAVAIYIAMDANKFSPEAFQATGSSRTTWQVWPIVLGVISCWIGTLVFALIWFLSKRAQVDAAAVQMGAPTQPPLSFGQTGQAPGASPPQQSPPQPPPPPQQSPPQPPPPPGDEDGPEAPPPAGGG